MGLLSEDGPTSKGGSTHKSFSNLLIISEKREDEEASEDGNIDLEDIEIE